MNQEWLLVIANNIHLMWLILDIARIFLKLSKEKRETLLKIRLNKIIKMRAFILLGRLKKKFPVRERGIIFWMVKRITRLRKLIEFVIWINQLWKGIIPSLISKQKIIKILLKSLKKLEKHLIMKRLLANVWIIKYFIKCDLLKGLLE